MVDCHGASTTGDDHGEATWKPEEKTHWNSSSSMCHWYCDNTPSCICSKHNLMVISPGKLIKISCARWHRQVANPTLWSLSKLLVNSHCPGVTIWRCCPTPTKLSKNNMFNTHTHTHTHTQHTHNTHTTAHKHTHTLLHARTHARTHAHTHTHYRTHTTTAHNPCDDINKKLKVALSLCLEIFAPDRKFKCSLYSPLIWLPMKINLFYNLQICFRTWVTVFPFILELVLQFTHKSLDAFMIHYAKQHKPLCVFNFVF